MTRLLYFAYGLNLVRKQMLECCPQSTPQSKVVLHHYKLIFVGWNRQWRGGVASIKPYRGERVIGGLYEISEADLRRLDKYQGYPADYSRLNVRVFTEDGEAIEALTYIKAGQYQETPPSKEYLALLEQGFRDWGVM